jgi:hypothetical protein
MNRHPGESRGDGSKDLDSGLRGNDLRLFGYSIVWLCAYSTDLTTKWDGRGGIAVESRTNG